MDSRMGLITLWFQLGFDFDSFDFNPVGINSISLVNSDVRRLKS